MSFEHGFSSLRFLACLKLGSVWDCNSPKPQDLEGRGSCLILDSIMFILYNVQYSDLETGFLFGLWSWQMGQGMSRSQGRKVGKLSVCRSLLLALGMDPVVAEHGISRAYPAEWPELLFYDAWHDLVI